MAEFQGFPKDTAKFLRGLTEHNDKTWFNAHRGDYEAFYAEPARNFVAAIGPKLQKISPGIAFEPKVNGSLFRINRDVRFSKDKTPYKNHIDLWFWHGDRRGWGAPGFFFRMFADRLILGAGQHKFEKEPLEAYRNAVVDERAGKALARTVEKMAAAGPYALGSATRKTVPRGLDADHPRAAFLLHDGLTVSLDTKPGAITETPEFVDFCLGHLKAMAPVARWLLDEVTEKD